MKKLQWLTVGMTALLLAGAFLAGSISNGHASAQATHSTPANAVTAPAPLAAQAAGLKLQPVRRSEAGAALPSPVPTQVSEPTTGTDPTEVAGTPEPPEAAGTLEPPEAAGQDSDNVQEEVGDQQGADARSTAPGNSALADSTDTDTVQEGDQQGPDTSGPETPDSPTGGATK